MLTLGWDHIGLYWALIQWLVSAQEGDLDTQEGHHVIVTAETRETHLQVKTAKAYWQSHEAGRNNEWTFPWAFRGSLALQMLHHHICLLKSSGWQPFLKICYQIFIIPNDGFHDYISIHAHNVFWPHSLPTILSCHVPRFQLLSLGIAPTNKHYKRIAQA